MYSVSHKKKKVKKNKVDLYQLINLDGFIMSSKKGFKINNSVIKDIKVVDKDIAHSLVSKKVMKLYDNLISGLTDLLTSDDDSGDDLREALNQIERFRLEIKNRYRNYLMKKEIEKMSHQLAALKKDAEERLIEINYNINHQLVNGKSR